ncbi:dimethyladenosine transferase 2, mitochondrial isoform X2 [Protopterus annectens]|nr:dimethyladenosine transferase 2, mitochondrial isoform X2 [Protopterus annectens]
MSLWSSRFVSLILRNFHCRRCGHQLLGQFRLYSSDGIVKRIAKSQPVQRLEKCMNVSAVTQTSLSTVARMQKGQNRSLSRYEHLEFDDVEEAAEKALACPAVRRFIVNPDLAKTVVNCLDPNLADSNAVIFECNPGPGTLTKALLNAGAQRVVALEGENNFLPELQSLENHLNGRLEVVHCDFFRLDPITTGVIRPPAMCTTKLFHDLGISEVSWNDDVPVKAVGIFGQTHERNMLWKLVYALYERISIYRYGRIELVMFMSEKEYLKLIAQPGYIKNYRALSVLWQIACEIELLHKEPLSSFVISSGSGQLGVRKSKLPNDNLCLVRLTPHKNLFSGALTPDNAMTFLVMIKQCFAKRSAKLVNRLNDWCPGCGPEIIKQLNLPPHIIVGHMFPEDFKRLFEAMEHSKEFGHSWLYNEVLVYTHRTEFLI